MRARIPATIAAAVARAPAACSRSRTCRPSLRRPSARHRRRVSTRRSRSSIAWATWLAVHQKGECEPDREVTVSPRRRVTLQRPVISAGTGRESRLPVTVRALEPRRSGGNRQGHHGRLPVVSEGQRLLHAHGEARSCRSTSTPASSNQPERPAVWRAVQPARLLRFHDRLERASGRARDRIARRSACPPIPGDSRCTRTARRWAASA